MDEVTVSAEAGELPARKYPGMSPLQAGLTYGGGAAAVMGPIGLLFGLGAGLVANRMRKSWLDKEAQHRQTLREEHVGLMQELDAERRQADPDEARLLDHAKRLAADGWHRMANGDYDTGSRMVAQANELSRGVMQADSEARKRQESENAAFQRGLVQTAANEYRSQYQAHMKSFEDIDQKTSEVLNLVNSEGFDPNSKFNKAVIMDLIQVGVNGIYRDDPSGLESLARSVPIIGDALGDFIKQDDYKLTPEDYNRIALELKRSNEQYTQQRMQRLGDQARSLDAGARKIGAIPQDYSLGDYVSGATKELRLTPVPTLKQSTKPTSPGAAYQNWKGGIQQWIDSNPTLQRGRKEIQRARPTN